MADTKQIAEAAAAQAQGAAQKAEAAEAAYRKLKTESERIHDAMISAKAAWADAAAAAVQATKASQLAWNEWALEAAQIAEDNVTKWARRAEEAAGPKTASNPVDSVNTTMDMDDDA